LEFLRLSVESQRDIGGFLAAAFADLVGVSAGTNFEEVG
jgi:hypothetical protein